jgi:hypothetical protein
VRHRQRLEILPAATVWRQEFDQTLSFIADSGFVPIVCMLLINASSSRLSIAIDVRDQAG